MFALSENIASLIGQHPAIHVHLSPELSALRLVSEDLDTLLRRHGPQRLDRFCAGGFSEVGAAFAKAAGAESIKALRAMPAEKGVEVFTNEPEGREFRAQVNVDCWVLPDETSNIFAQRKHNDVPAIVGSNRNEMTTLTTPAMVPKTLEDFRKRIESQYGKMVKQFDAVYPVKSTEDIKDAYLGSLRD